MIEEQTPGIEAVMAALAERGPCTGPSLAAHLGCSSEVVRSRLGKLETVGRVRRTGRALPRGRSGGRPPTEWEVVSANGGRAAEGTPGPPRPFPPRPLDERLKLMAEQVERANDRIEHLEGALAGAAARADQAEKHARDADQRRFAAERAVAASFSVAATSAAEIDSLLQAHDEAERLRAEASRDLEAARARIAELEAAPPAATGGDRSSADALQPPEHPYSTAVEPARRAH
jgi:predicted ArsR family transcriptional regulator